MNGQIKIRKGKANQINKLLAMLLIKNILKNWFYDFKMTFISQLYKIIVWERLTIFNYFNM